MSAATAVIALESEACLDPDRVGAKASRLAEALRHGLPVVPGVVIPADVGDRVLADASRDIGQTGVHAARLAIMSGTSPDLTDLPQRLTQLGDDLVVRSSSPLEGSSDYAGVFTSYVGVTPAEAVTAVRGVWASALASHDLSDDDASPSRRREIAPRMAVLVQLHFHPSFAGTARVERDGEVRVLAVAGPSAPLMSGWARGDAATVGVDDVVVGPAVSTVGEQILRGVASIARQVKAALSDDLIEWATGPDGTVLLQSQRAARPSSSIVPNWAPDVPPEAAGVARLIQAFAGALGEEFLLPFILAGVEADVRVPIPAKRETITAQVARAAWADVHRLVRRLRDQVWGGDMAVPTRLLALMRTGDIPNAVASFAASPRCCVTEASRLVDLLRLIAAWLEANSALLSANDIWGVPPREVEGLIAGRSSATAAARREQRRIALTRWEPMMYVAIEGTGVRVDGEAASSGLGAGEAVVVRGIPARRPNIPRMVVVAPLPIPQLAPLMWGSAGLVTAGGSPSAHLIEVARSRGVPAVVGCDDLVFSLLEQEQGQPLSALVAVNGDSGRVVIDVRSAAHAK